MTIIIFRIFLSYLFFHAVNNLIYKKKKKESTPKG